MNYRDSQIPPDFYREVSMNIFIMHSDYELSALLHPSKVLVKMLVEHLQMLSSVVRQLAPDYADRYGLYKLSHKSHPCTLWAMSSKENFQELIDRTEAMHTEYKRRGYKEHKSPGLLKNVKLALRHITFKPIVGLDTTPDGYAMAFNAVSGIEKDYTKSAIPQYQAYMLTKSYTQPFDPLVYYILDHPRITLANPELIQLRNDLFESNKMELIALDTFRCHGYAVFFELKRLGYSNGELHQAYYHLLRDQGFNRHLLDCYQRFCGEHLGYTACPSLRSEVKPKRKSTKKAKPVVEVSEALNVNDNYSQDYQMVLEACSKVYSPKLKPEWSEERRVEHCWYHLRKKLGLTKSTPPVSKFNKLPFSERLQLLYSITQ